MQLPLLGIDSLRFPNPELALAEPNGLLAVGGDLSVSRLLEAYRQGIFPWFNADEPILWWAPAPRSVLQPEHIRISKSTRKAIRKNNWLVSVDIAFDKVIRKCGKLRQKEGTWISDTMVTAYNELFHAGHAHSIEVWQDATLIGGLYGVQIGAVFFGESMFSEVSNTSKTAMLLLQQLATDKGIQLIDCQLQSEHLDSLGAESVSREQFQTLLADYCDQPTDLFWRRSPYPARELLAP